MNERLFIILHYTLSHMFCYHFFWLFLNLSQIYVGCDEAFRLNPSGNINVPLEATDFFCSGPCLTEAQLVLNCIDDILSNFLFYNKATVQQMRYALNAGCSFSRQRGFPVSTYLKYQLQLSLLFSFSLTKCMLGAGNFNLAEYIDGETSNAPKSTILSKFYVFILAAAIAGAVYLI